MALHLMGKFKPATTGQNRKRGICSHDVLIRFPQVPYLFLTAPQFYPIWFAQSSTPMCVNWKGPFLLWRAFDSILRKQGPKKCFYWGGEGWRCKMCLMFQNWKKKDGPINMATSQWNVSHPWSIINMKSHYIILLFADTFETLEKEQFFILFNMEFFFNSHLFWLNSHPGRACLVL